MDLGAANELDLYHVGLYGRVELPDSQDSIRHSTQGSKPERPPADRGGGTGCGCCRHGNILVYMFALLALTHSMSVWVLMRTAFLIFQFPIHLPSLKLPFLFHLPLWTRGYLN